MFSQDPASSCDKFDKIFLEVLNKHTPSKTKILRVNHSYYICKSLRKAIMKTLYLEKLYFKNRTENLIKTYKRQKNTVADFIKKKEKNFLITLIPLNASKDSKIAKIAKLFGKQ